ncbi:MAG: hypothetical protein K8U03_22420 [Planctomycetia bacterium]|nr:hypothetical protein [Planctomycetia bacterium]
MSTTSPTRRNRSESFENGQPETSAAEQKPTPPVVPQAESPPQSESSPEPIAALPADIVREAYLTRPDRLPCFYDGTAPKLDARNRSAAMRSAALDMETTDPENAASIRKLVKRTLRRDGRPTTEKRGFPKPAASYHSEADQLSVLRTDWTEQGVQVAIDWSTPAMRIEMLSGNKAILDGRIPPRVRVGGSACDPVGPWEEVCWESNVDVDYLELEIALAGDVRVQRQIILTRRDGLLFMADAVISPTVTNLACELALPLVKAGAFTPATETREATLQIGKRKLLLLPLALKEWRTESCLGDLNFDHGNVVLRQQAVGAEALYVPICLVFDRKRSKRDCTWRRLTVGENLRLVPPYEACGYRWQLGKEHWLVYRSLSERRANRTLLGINLQTNFLLSRFTTAGESEPLIEIDD